MGCFTLNRGYINNFSVLIIDEESNGEKFQALYVTLETDVETFKFRITEDVRQPNINIIKEKIESGLGEAKNSNSYFGISEYRERFYLYVHFPDGTQEQYSGKMI